MRAIIATGKPEEDARILAEAVGESNPISREEAKQRERDASAAQKDGPHNALTEVPFVEGQIMAILPDEEVKKPEEKKSEETPQGMPRQRQVITAKDVARLSDVLGQSE